jgi:hypothetical protein
VRFFFRAAVGARRSRGRGGRSQAVRRGGPERRQRVGGDGLERGGFGARRFGDRRGGVPRRRPGGLGEERFLTATGLVIGRRGRVLRARARRCRRRREPLEAGRPRADATRGRAQTRERGVRGAHEVAEGVTERRRRRGGGGARSRARERRRGVVRGERREAALAHARRRLRGDGVRRGRLHRAERRRRAIRGGARRGVRHARLPAPSPRLRAHAPRTKARGRREMRRGKSRNARARGVPRERGGWGGHSARDASGTPRVARDETRAPRPGAWTREARAGAFSG